MARERSEEDQIQGEQAAEAAGQVEVEEPSAEVKQSSAEVKQSSAEVEQPSAEVKQPSAEEQHRAEDELAAEAEGAEALRLEIDQLQEQLALHRDMALRSQAELQNARRRAQQDVEKAHKFGVEKLLSDLLPVVDNLERALATIDSEDEAHKAVVEGIELTRKSFLDTLAKYQVEVLDPAGEPFDPELHQAMTQVPNGDVEPNTVLEVFQKGYRLHGRLVRPALVVVSKALS